MLKYEENFEEIVWILLKLFFDGVVKDFYLISVYLYIIIKKMYGKVSVGGLNLIFLL